MKFCTIVTLGILLLVASSSANADEAHRYVLWYEFPLEDNTWPYQPDSFTISQNGDFKKIFQFGQIINEDRLAELENLVCTQLDVKHKIVKGEKVVVVTPDDKHYKIDNHLERKFSMTLTRNLSIYEALVRFNAELNQQTKDCTWYLLKGSYGDNAEIIPECLNAKLGEDIVATGEEARSILMRILDATDICQGRVMYKFYNQKSDVSQFTLVELDMNFLENFEHQNFKKFTYRREEFEASREKSLVDFPRLPPQEWFDARKDKCSKVAGE